MPERGRFATSIGASALLHMLVLGGLFALAVGPKPAMRLPSLEVDLASLPLPAPPPAAQAPPAAPVAPQPAPPEAAPQPAIPLPERQIVDPPDAGEEKEPAETRLLSDRSITVPEEVVKRGDGGTNPDAADHRLSRAEGAAAKPEPAPEPPPPARREAPRPRPAAPAARPAPGDLGGERLAALPSLDKLLPRAEELALSQPPPAATPRERSGRDLLNSGGQVFSGRPGTRDFLPGIREGNITLLNTKADLFAPFVRRVAGRVFENLELGLSNLRRSRSPGSGRTVAMVEAVMDRNGRFIRAELVDQQGLSVISRLLLNSAQPDTFFDANPPSGAEANDGLIHFRLMIDLFVDAAVDPRTGREYMTYQGVAGVGLL